MAALAFLVLAVLAASSDASRIIGGWPTTVEKYSSIVQVENRIPILDIWGQACAASILNTRYVLSAAHCFAGIFYQARNRRIRAGATMRDTGGVLVYVEREFNHPSYNIVRFDGDVTVVRLIGALEYSPVIQPVQVISQGTQLPDNLPVQYAGWGLTSYFGDPSDELLETSVFTVNHEICAARFMSLNPPTIVTENMICAGLLDVGGQDACHGDSGGPLYYTDPNLGNIIVGVVSWGEECALAEFPGVNTAVSSYTQWIVDTAV